MIVKKVFYKFLLSILFGIGILINTQMVANAQEKVIAIVYDNSSSMTFTENTGPFITRWVEADYAIRAFAACMEAGDKIWLYPMNSGTEISSYEINGKENWSNIDKASKIFYGATPYDNVDNAITELNEKADGAEKWIIILTDGVFTDKKSDSNELQGNLETSLRSSDIRMLYVPIGDNTVKLNSSSLPDNLMQIESQDGILGLVLECMNEIYHRRVLETVKLEGGNAEITIDAPLSELFILLQQEGEETLYSKYADGNKEIYEAYTANLKSQTKDLEEKLNSNNVTKPSRVVNDNVFESYNGETPVYIGEEELGGQNVEDIFSDELKTKPIVGNLLYVEWNNCNINQDNIIEYKLPIVEGESVEIYYQLDFGLEIEIYQDGNKVEGNEIQEGEYEVTIYPVTKDKTSRVATDASLMKNVKLTVNGNACSLGETIKMTAVYGNDVNIIAVAEDDALAQPVTENVQLSVKENIYRIQINAEMPDYFDYDMMNRECIEGGAATGIKLQFSEKNTDALLPLRETSKEQLKVEYSITYRGLKDREAPQIEIMEMGGEREDERYIYPYLKEPNDFNVYRDVYCTITAYREDAREQSEQTIKVNLNLQAKEAKVSAELIQDEPYTLTDLFMGKALSEIDCNEEPILDSEWKKVEFRALEGDFSLGAFSKEWRLFDGLRWFFCGDEVVPVHKEVIYTRRGVECVTILEGNLLYQPVSVVIRTLAIILMIAVLVSIIYWLVRIWAGYCFGRDFKAYIWLLEPTIQSYEEEVVKEKGRKAQMLLPKNMQLILSEGEDRLAADFPDMEIRKVKGQKAFIVVNGEQFSKLEYSIDGGIIKEGTIVQFTDCIKIVTSEGQHYELRFQKSR